MKFRNGFVSNSSSSSFVVLFDKKPKSEKEIIEILGLKGKIRHDIVKKILQRSNACNGHIKTFKELQNARIIKDLWAEPWACERDQYSLEIFGEKVIRTIQQKIDSYFHYPEHPYKVVIDMGDQHYGLDIADSCDTSRFIPFASIQDSYAIDSGDREIPRKTIKQITESYAEESDEEDD